MYRSGYAQATQTYHIDFVSIILFSLHIKHSFFAGERELMKQYYNKKGIYRF